MATKAAAGWAANLEWSSLPPNVPHAAVRCFYNWMGCAIGGSDHPTTQKAYRALLPFFGKETSKLLGQTRKADAQHAALINGIASHVHDYDDTHLATIIHPTGPVASALLAYAETQKGVSGRDFLLALIAGIEVQCKLGLAVWPEHYDIGWHITSTVGTVGAAVAICKLMRLSPLQIQHAIGIAATQVTGLRDHFGTDTKSFHPGRAAQNGLLAAILAQQDYTASPDALEAKRGWANCVSTRNNLDELFGKESLGKVWEIEKNSFKPFPCGIVAHPAIDACVQLHGELAAKGVHWPRTAERVQSVHLRVHPLVIELTAKKTPKDGLEAKFSVFHGCAVALWSGKAGPAQYADEIVQGVQVVALRGKIEAEIEDSLEADQCEATLKLSDGSTLHKHIEHAVGSLEAPMTDSQLEKKFLDQCERVLGDCAKDVSDLCWKVEAADDMAEFMRSLDGQ